MSKVFVPLTDEILYEHPEMINGPVIPYVAGRSCYHWLSVELSPREEVSVKHRTRGTFLKLLNVFKMPAVDKAVRGETPSLLSP